LIFQGPMSETALQSTRFTRAARAELDRLERRRERAEQELREVESELAGARETLAKIAEQQRALRAIAGEEAALAALPSPDRAPGKPLSGSAIREVAIQLLREHPGSGAIHYREWQKLVEDAGFTVNGKRPDAVFLGQIKRSPVVRATTRAGFYELDGGAPERIGREIQALEREMASLSENSASPDPEELGRRLERQEEVALQLRRAQRALREAVQSLGSPKGSAQRLAA
jgi:hypothetical protein